MLTALIHYLIYMLSGLGLLTLFVLVYTKVTPYDEFALIRQGCLSAALSLGGALLGFSLTLAASVMHNASFDMFIFWAFCAMVVQIIAHLFLSKLLPNMNQNLIENNVAMGALMGALSLAIGLINAGCLS
ncbi:DUF350 domain-containing protein [Iodobacter fluviatilis]|uniref:DUF350 domain-containing protein n=1 Tax=Iodobacter fluviatilis TaxID=537 RepID=A0A7G3GA95_9NEIS|nr:DUF350 domain-containing protein [Iodobacter fluviatilis]QBC44003.1 hypothetical protein C1H71_10955 [Iodobacter fluviatilis]